MIRVMALMLTMAQDGAVAPAAAEPDPDTVVKAVCPGGWNVRRGIGVTVLSCEAPRITIVTREGNFRDKRVKGRRGAK